MKDINASSQEPKVQQLENEVRSLKDRYKKEISGKSNAELRDYKKSTMVLRFDDNTL
ncbi:MAG: hypothetical protein JKY54_16470 [Flavobacteriales bacterium]|nr:hypothetical protein [Flavobacteriales bacterium]